MRYEVVVSVDQAGILEYWTTAKNDYKFPAKIVSFESKLDTGNVILCFNHNNSIEFACDPLKKSAQFVTSSSRLRVF